MNPRKARRQPRTAAAAGRDAGGHWPVRDHPRAAVVLDIEGVIAPIAGHTVWGDDVNAAIDPWPVNVSPAMCAALDSLAGDPAAGLEGSAGPGNLVLLADAVA